MRYPPELPDPGVQLGDVPAPVLLGALPDPTGIPPKGPDGGATAADTPLAAAL
jgi:hypothetical protein